MRNSASLQVKISVNTPNLGDQFAGVVQKSKGFELMKGPQKQWPDLLILELGAKPEKGLSIAEDLLKQGKVKEIFLISDSTDPTILMQAMRMGIKEFFPLPLDISEVTLALERFRERISQRLDGSGRLKTGKIISIGGSKGGVGTTTISVNLAVACAESRGKPSVALLDMNTMLGEVPLFLEISPKFHWGEVTKNINRLDKEFLLKVLTRHKSGVQVLPSPAYLNGHHSPTPDIMQRLLDEMKAMFDVVVIDAGQPMGDASLKALQLSDDVLLVSVLSLPCLSNTVKMMRSYVDMGYVQRENINVILNRHMKKSEISIPDAEASLGKSVYFSIPNDYITSMAAINSGKPLSHVAPKSEIARSFTVLANKLIATEENAKQERIQSWSLFRRRN